MIRCRGPLLAGLVSLLPCLAAAAQERAADTLPVVSIDTLAVRVLHTPLPAARAPYAVSAVAGPELRRGKPGLTLEEALLAVPGVQVDNRYNWALGERISIRGFGARTQFGVRGVRVLVDGIPATLPDGQTTLNHVDPALLGRAEIIRGPASALYGNAAGGVIRLSSVEPPAVPFASEYRVVAGGDGLLRLQSTAGGRTRGLAYHGALTRVAFGGYRDHAEAVSTLFSAGLAYRGRRDEVRLALGAVGYDALNPGSLPDSLLRRDRTQAFARNVAQRTGEEGRQGQLGVTWQHALGNGSLEVAAYALAREIDNPIPTAVIDLRRRVAGARAAWSGAHDGGALRLRWTAGAEVDHQHDDRRNFANEAGERGTLALDQVERVTGAAAFAQAVASLGRVDVLGAVRYDRFRFSARDELATAGNPDDSGARTLHALSPTLGVTLAVGRGVSLYANVATAFETPTTTELANRPTGAGGFNPELDPQRTTSGEAGVKGRAGPRATFELAAYRARVRDALVPFEVEGAPGRQFFRNAGEAVHRGVEASVAVAPLPWLGARAAYSWTDARFGRYQVGGEDLRGNRVPGIAPHRLEATLSAVAERGPFAALDVRWLDRVPVADTDDEGLLASPAYTVADLRAGWQEARLERIGVRPFVGVTNLFGVDYNTSVTVNAFGGRFYEPGPGRGWYVGADLTL
ncbi:MAG TPA: TonB-dependent receptor [Longimicrobiaceae bacterium]|nr:TonB-dependent receptor [Longimicrobiaceae bacterium]